MQAMVLNGPGENLRWMELPDQAPGPGQVQVRVTACGVCRTDLHVVDSELPDIRYPIVPGHEIVGRVERLGEGVSSLRVGQRVGIPWLGHTCGHCPYCLSGRENLCDAPLFTGYTQWRLRYHGRGGCPFCLRTGRSGRRRCAGAMVVRRTDRMALARQWQATA